MGGSSVRLQEGSSGGVPYYYLTYEGSVDLEQEKIFGEGRPAQIQEFADAKQLFAGAQSSRNDLMHPWCWSLASIDPTAATTTGSSKGTSSNSNSYSNASASALAGARI